MLSTYYPNKLQTFRVRGLLHVESIALLTERDILLVRVRQVMYTLHHRIFVMRQSRVFPEPGHSATAHAISGRVIAVVYMSAPTASLYGNFSIYSSSSGVCDPSALREGWHPRRSWCPACLLDAELLHHPLHFELSSRLSGEPLYRRLGASKNVVHVHSPHRLHLSIIELTEYAWIRFWLLKPGGTGGGGESMRYNEGTPRPRAPER